MNRMAKLLVISVSVTVLGATEIRAQTPALDPFVIDLDQVEWGPPGTAPRFPQGVQTTQLGVDPENGGPTYLARFPSGSHFDLHWHTYDEYVVVLSGEGVLELGDDTHVLSPNVYIVIPARMNHSWDVPSGASDLVILVRRSGPADFNFVEPDP